MKIDIMNSLSDRYKDLMYVKTFYMLPGFAVSKGNGFNIFVYWLNLLVWIRK